MRIPLDRETHQQLQALGKAHGLNPDQALQYLILLKTRELQPEAYLRDRAKADPQVLEALERS